MTTYISYSQLLEFTNKALIKSGVNKFCSKYVSEGLCKASLRGTDSHGINLLPHYLNSVISGRKNPKPNFKFYKKFNSSYLLDADNGYGISAGVKAVAKGCLVANKNGICTVGVINSSHPGALAPIALHGVKKGFIIFAFTHADSLQLSFGSKRPYFGTNPICFAAPGYKNNHFCLDMATTNINWNKLLNYKRLGKELPRGMAVDINGRATTNPEKAYSLTSIGGYKGFGLAAMVEILCSVFLGMNFGKNIPSMYKSSIKIPRKLGQLYIILRSDTFIKKKKFLKDLKKMSTEVKNHFPINKKKKILLANEIENQTEKKRLKTGIPIDKELFNKLKNISKKFNIEI